MRKIIPLLLAANLLLCTGIIVLLPPFEGIDETANYSRIKSQAFVTQTPSAADKTEATPSYQHIAKEVYDYYRAGPMPFGWITFDQRHDEDPLKGYMTYRDFFAQPDRAANYMQLYRDAPIPTGFAPGPETDWQYQHPALYYLAMAPVMKVLAGHASLATAIVVLRLVSFAFAFAGFCIGIFATRKYLAALKLADADTIIALGLLYPFLMPEFFWEFTRIGNDGMCLFLFGVIWALLLWHLREPRSDAWMYLGFFMGLSWLVKALMIPVTAGIVAFLVLYHLFVLRRKTEYVRDWWLAPLKTLFALALIGLPVYLSSYAYSGGLGSGELNGVLHAGNIFTQLEKAFTWPILWDGLREIYVTGIWGWGYASWSEMNIAMPDLFYGALYLFCALVIVAFVLSMRRRPGPLYALALFTLGPMFAGLVAHIFMMRMLAPDAQYAPATPGYYVHILAPCYVLVFGLGLKELIDKKLTAVVVVLSVPITLFNFYIPVAFATAFAGCVKPVYEGNIYWLPPADIDHCAGQFNLMLDRLAVLVWPGAAGACFALSLVLLLAAVLIALRIHRFKHLPAG